MELDRETDRENVCGPCKWGEGEEYERHGSVLCLLLPLFSPQTPPPLPPPQWSCRDVWSSESKTAPSPDAQRLLRLQTALINGVFSARICSFLPVPEEGGNTWHRTRAHGCDNENSPQTFLRQANLNKFSNCAPNWKHIGVPGQSLQRSGEDICSLQTNSLLASDGEIQKTTNALNTWTYACVRGCYVCTYNVCVCVVCVYINICVCVYSKLLCAYLIDQAMRCIGLRAWSWLCSAVNELNELRRMLIRVWVNRDSPLAVARSRNPADGHRRACNH